MGAKHHPGLGLYTVQYICIYTAYIFVYIVCIIGEDSSILHRRHIKNIYVIKAPEFNWV